MIFDSVIFGYAAEPILRGVFLELHPGTITGLVGRNGCGKSTLIRIGAGFLVPDDGTIFIDRQNMSILPMRRRYKKIAYLPQEFFLPTTMRVSSVLKWMPHGTAAVAMGRLYAWSKRRIGDLSCGERRFLEIAMLLGLKRNYVLLDEPFTGIEPKYIQEISDLLREAAAAGAGLLVTDHYHRYLLPLCNDLVVLSGGYGIILDPAEPFSSQLQYWGYLQGHVH